MLWHVCCQNLRRQGNKSVVISIYTGNKNVDPREYQKKKWGSLQCNQGLTMSMTSLRRLCRCRLVRFWKMSQFSSCRSLNPTARWWFSSTDSSLYINASSESVEKEQARLLVDFRVFLGPLQKQVRTLLMGRFCPFYSQYLEIASDAVYFHSQ